MHSKEEESDDSTNTSSEDSKIPDVINKFDVLSSDL